MRISRLNDQFGGGPKDSDSVGARSPRGWPPREALAAPPRLAAAVAVAVFSTKAADEERLKRQTRERADADEASTPRLSDAISLAARRAASHSLARLASARARAPRARRRAGARGARARRSSGCGGCSSSSRHTTPPRGRRRHVRAAARAPRERWHATIAALATVLERSGAEPGSGGSIGGRGLKREGSASGRDLERARASSTRDARRGGPAPHVFGHAASAPTATRRRRTRCCARGSCRATRRGACSRCSASTRTGARARSAARASTSRRCSRRTIFEGDETKVAASADETPAEAADRAAREAAVARIQRIQRGRLARKTMVFKKKYRPVRGGAGPRRARRRGRGDPARPPRRARKRLLQRRDRANTHRALLAAAATTADMDHAQFADARARHASRPTSRLGVGADVRAAARLALGEVRARVVRAHRRRPLGLGHARRAAREPAPPGRRRGRGRDRSRSASTPIGDNDVSFPSTTTVMKCAASRRSLPRAELARERAFVTLDDPASSPPRARCSRSASSRSSC